MSIPVTTLEGAIAALPDVELVSRILGGEPALFEIVMRRHNQRLYRAARAILQDEAEVEDVLQQAYLNAFAHLDQFEQRSQLSTWLTRIVINESTARRRRAARHAEAPPLSDGVDEHNAVDALATAEPDPEHRAYAGELQRVLEEAVDTLPESYRVVFMLRDIEGLSTSETAEGLGLGDEAVKTRLHRARALIRRAITDRIGAAAAAAFPFHAPRCDRVVFFVLSRVGGMSASAITTS